MWRSWSFLKKINDAKKSRKFSRKVVNKESRKAHVTKFPLDFLSHIQLNISLTSLIFSKRKIWKKRKFSSFSFSHFSDFTFLEENCHKLATFQLVIFFFIQFASLNPHQIVQLHFMCSRVRMIEWKKNEKFIFYLRNRGEWKSEENCKFFMFLVRCVKLKTCKWKNSNEIRLRRWKVHYKELSKLHWIFLHFVFHRISFFSHLTRFFLFPRRKKERSSTFSLPSYFTRKLISS